MGRCYMIVSPGIEHHSDVECQRVTVDGWNICADCLRDLRACGDFTEEELAQMYRPSEGGGRE